ncbi:MAG: hypothetical protein ACR2MQ_01250 [Gemmatimonadaceae bacterium]
MNPSPKLLRSTAAVIIVSVAALTLACSSDNSVQTASVSPSVAGSLQSVTIAWATPSTRTGTALR